ncbi:HD-GYP domain-containing protein [Ammonifex degensii]|uniref:HD-GYP domain-containing protein n=1 Tax=Ammonifex degensii TaxID=42838 RepID=UPI0002E6FEEB|nr:HD domain-containing phosphohydrolase [Ammonifex degensii]
MRKVKLRTIYPLTENLLEQLAAKDKTTYLHSLHVAEVASLLAREMGFVGEERALYEAGLLHDIGKLYVPQELLFTRRVFSSIERLEMQKHVSYTYAILTYHNYPHTLAEICFQHHERLDGSGYPRGLRGEAITLEGRILAVADVFAALISPRPYRGALSPRQAVEILHQEVLRGRLAMEVVAALVRKLDECCVLCGKHE